MFKYRFEKQGFLPHKLPSTKNVKIPSFKSFSFAFPTNKMLNSVLILKKREKSTPTPPPLSFKEKSCGKQFQDSKKTKSFPQSVKPPYDNKKIG